MIKEKVTNSTVHKTPADLQKALTSTLGIIAKWQNLTPLARNEWICWIESAKKPDTRVHRIKRTYTELMAGKRRPCCWAGCIHR